MSRQTRLMICLAIVPAVSGGCQTRESNSVIDAKTDQAAIEAYEAENAASQQAMSDEM